MRTTTTLRCTAETWEVTTGHRISLAPFLPFQCEARLRLLLPLPRVSTRPARCAASNEWTESTAQPTARPHPLRPAPPLHSPSPPSSSSTDDAARSLQRCCPHHWHAQHPQQRTSTRLHLTTSNAAPVIHCALNFRPRTPPHHAPFPPHPSTLPSRSPTQLCLTLTPTATAT